MAGFFYNLGKAVGAGTRKANWILQSLTGTEAQAIEAEYAMGKDIANAYANDMQLDSDPAVQQYLDQISVRLAPHSMKRERRFCFRAVRKDEFNAFALPGGFIFVMRPLLELCEWNEDEVAFVLAHEMGHVELKHSINRLMANSAIRGALARLPIGGLLGLGIMEVATDLLNQGYSREQELEADAHAVQLARAAGFQPDGGIRMLQRLRAIPEDKWFGSAYFSSHPPIEARTKNIRRLVAQISSSL